MKTQLSLLLFIFLFFGCNKDQIEKDSFGEFSALKNGEPWVDSILNTYKDPIEGSDDPINSFKIIYTNCPDTTITVLMRRIIKSNYEYLRFRTESFKTRKYTLIDMNQNCRFDNFVQAGFGTLFSGDSGGKSYDLLPSDDNYFSIKSIDRNKNVITGEFQVTFININDDTDTVRFTEGEFQTSIIQPPSP